MAARGITNDDRAQSAATRNAWAPSAPALILLTFAAAGPLLIVLVYSFLSPGQYGNVEWRFSLDGWTGIVVTRDIFDRTLGPADAHLTIFWRSVKLSLLTTVITFGVGSILVFVPCLGAYVTPRILGGGKLMMIGNFIELQFGQGRNWPLGAAISMTLLVVVMIALLFYVRTLSTGRKDG